MRFEWDSHKNRANFEKHGIWLEEAQTVWSNARSLEFFDVNHSENEDRFIRIGISSLARLLLVIFCERENETVIRIISARRATQRELEFYEKGI